MLLLCYYRVDLEQVRIRNMKKIHITKGGPSLKLESEGVVVFGVGGSDMSWMRRRSCEGVGGWRK